MRISLIGTEAKSFLIFRKDLLIFLIKKGMVVYVVLPNCDPETKNQFLSLGVEVIDYPLMRKSLNPFSELKSCYLLAQTLKKLDLDIVISFFIKPTIYGTFAARVAGVPKIYAMLEGLGFFFTEHPVKTPIKTKFVKNILLMLFQISFRFLDGLFFLNSDDKQEIISMHKIKVKKYKVLNGIGINLKELRYSTPEIGKISFIFVARLIKEKGVKEYIEAASLVKTKYPDVSFCILGSIDSSSPGALTQVELDEIVLSGVITHPGYVTDVNMWLRKSSVFVLPSYYREGLPRSIMEAMAVGRAIITTDVPGCRETVIDGYNGFLIPPLNPKILAEKMEIFIKNSRIIVEMGRNSRKLAEERMDVEAINLQMWEFIQME